LQDCADVCYVFFQFLYSTRRFSTVDEYLAVRNSDRNTLHTVFCLGYACKCRTNKNTLAVNGMRKIYEGIAYYYETKDRIGILTVSS
jgi:hypothetical protein